MEKYDIVVIGGGPSGITLAKRLSKKYKMAIIRPEDYSMIYCAMPYAVEGLMPIETTFKKDELVTNAGADLIKSTVTKIDFENNSLFLEDGKEISYDKIVIATGANPFLPPIGGIELNGVMGFKTATDMIKLNLHIEQGVKNAVVVGAGAIGIELAQALNKKGLHVDLVDMDDSILPNMNDFEMAEKVEEELIRSGIDLHLKTRVLKLQGENFVQEVVLDNGDMIKFGTGDDCSLGENNDLLGLVVFATGMRPEISLVKDSKLELGRDGIVVNGKMETNLPDVYAVGDCVQFTSGITGDVFPGKLATNAVPMSKVLASNLLGEDKSYPGFYNGVATKVGKFYIGGTGLSERMAKKFDYETVSGYSELTSKFPIMPGAKKIYFKLIANKKTMKIIGAQIISEEPVTDRIDLLTFAIQNETLIEDLTNLSYASQPYQSFYPAANLVIVAAEDLLSKVK